MLSKLAIRRLTKLADYMESLPKSADKHFRMSSWFHHNGGHSHGIKNNTPLSLKDLTYCGTTACAAGWACTVPSFRKAGLALIKDTAHCFGGRVVLNSREADSLQDFFEIDDNQVTHLFGGRVRAASTKTWAKRCRKFLRDNA